MDLVTKNPFLCPECGSTKEGTALTVSTEYDPNDPWTAVLQIIECSDCQSDIPAHIGERWNGLSIEDAKEEWRKVYRKQGKGNPR